MLCCYSFPPISDRTELERRARHLESLQSRPDVLDDELLARELELAQRPSPHDA